MSFFEEIEYKIIPNEKGDIYKIATSKNCPKFTKGDFYFSEVKPKIILADIGMVTETDVTLAKASNAVLIAFNVKPSKEAKKLAEKENIKISTYNIIKCLEVCLS